MSEGRLKWAHGLRVKVKDRFNRSRVLLGVETDSIETGSTREKTYAPADTYIKTGSFVTIVGSDIRSHVEGLVEDLRVDVMLDDGSHGWLWECELELSPLFLLAAIDTDMDG